MENDEIAILKVKDQLLRDIDQELSFILESEHQNQNVDSKHQQQRSLQRLLDTIQNFQPAPQLLDQKLNLFVQKLCENYDIEASDTRLNLTIGEIFYQFTKIRGFKTISSCLSSDIYLLEPILAQLDSSQHHLDWKQNFFLLLWLSILVLNPFPLKTVDENLPDKIYELSFKFFTNNSKELDVAAILLSRFLSRPDNNTHLNKFYTKIANVQNDSEYMILSLLRTLNHLLKTAQLSVLSPFIESHYNFVKQYSESSNLSILKLDLKNLGKLGEIVVDLGQFDLLEDIINLLLPNLNYSNTVIRYSVAKQVAKIAAKLEPDFQQEILEMVLQDLEIPQFSISHTLVEFDIDYDLVNINKYHGSLLTIAEFLNLNIISENYLHTIVSLIHKTLFLEQVRLTYSVGSNIRDLSCYNAWSLVKKYKQMDTTMLKTLFQDLLLACLFDKDIMIRRAASAVIQELVGRFGDLIYSQFTNWKVELNYFKLKLIELLDFNLLGDIKRSFALSEVITNQLNGEFRGHFLNHLYHLCLHHDYDLRKLSILHFMNLILENDMKGYISHILNQDSYKHGQIYLLAELLQRSSPDSSDLNKATKLISGQTFNSHKDNWSKGEEILHLISILMPSQPATFFDDCVNVIFDIIKVTGTLEIPEKFEDIVLNLPYISDEFFDKLLYYVKMGNNASVACSFRAFKSLDRAQLSKILDIVEDQKQDCEVRAALIDSLSIYFYEHQFDLEVLIRVINQLDDYTVTSQGDVGSKLRLATVRFVDNNFDVFRGQHTSLVSYINLKLVRLNFDMIDKLRRESFQLFCKTFDLLDMVPVMDNDIVYFDILLTIYKEKIMTDKNPDLELMSQEFWKGYSLLAGALISSNTLTQNSLKSLFVFLANSPRDDSLSIFNKLGVILSKNTKFSISEEQSLQLGVEMDFASHEKRVSERFVKLQNSALLLFERIFELNIRFPQEFDFKSLFIKVFNLQLNQLNQSRLKACFKLFKFLYLQNREDLFFEKGKKRMIQLLCTSTNGRIRALCSEVLYELYFEADPKANEEYLQKLDSVDWSENKSFASYLKFFK